MRELKLFGVHDDGEHLVLVDDHGEKHRLRIDEPLRAAARRDRPRLGQLQIEIDNDVRPREVQAMIRAGATADEVAARTGWSLERIGRFEGPVLAEREHVAQLAQTVRLRGTNAAGGSETLAQRAATRFAGRGVSTPDVTWDAARDAEGQWTVTARFIAGGRERAATWWFDIAGLSVVAKNDEAKWLSEADAPPGPLSAPAHRPTVVFDVESETGGARRARKDEADGLIASMKEQSGARTRRRGRRKPPADEPLPLDGDFADGEPQEGHLVDESDVSPGAPAEGPATGRRRSSAKNPADYPPPARGTHPADAEDVPTKSGTGTAAPAVVADLSDSPAPDAAPSADATDVAKTDMASTDTASVPDASNPPNVDAEPEAEPGAATAPGVDGPVDRASQDAAKVAEEAPASNRDGTSEDESVQDDEDADPVFAASADDPPTPAEDGGAGKSPRKPRKGRARVPSWDDVMFGNKRD